MQERQHGGGEGLGLLLLRHVGGVGQGDDPGIGQQRGVTADVVGGDQPVMRAAQEQRRAGDAMQPVRQLGIVQIRLPGEQREGFAVAQHDAQFLVGHGGGFGAVFFGIDIQHALHRIGRLGEHVGDVEFIAAAGLHPGGRHQHEPAQALRLHGGEFGRDPAAERRAHDVELGNIQPVQQFQIQMGDVVRAGPSSRPAPTARTPDAMAR